MGCASSKGKTIEANPGTRERTASLQDSSNIYGHSASTGPPMPPGKFKVHNNLAATFSQTNQTGAFPAMQQEPWSAKGQDISDDKSDFDSEDEVGDDSNSNWDDFLVQQAEELFVSPATSTSAPVSAGHHRPMASGGSFAGDPGLGIFGLNDRQRLDTLRETSSLRLSKLRGCTFVNQYVVIKYLGRGASGRVFLCMDINNNNLYAVKIVKKGALEAQLAARADAGKNNKRRRTVLEDLLAEISVMKKLRHRNIVTLREVVDDPESNKLLLVMDYMEGGPVMTREALDKGHRIPETVARQYFRDMCKALDYLHHNRIVHGDLKPENVLMSAKGNVALSDFGCSKVIMNGDDTLDRCNGTPAFLAPEMMKPNAKYRGRPADVYALGACLYTFAFGRIPFNAPSVAKLFQIVQTEPLRFPSQIPVSEELHALLLGMLEKDPDRRLSLRQIMAHPWVTLNGRWPCKTLRDLKAQESSGDQGNIDTMREIFEDDLPPLDFMATVNVVDIPMEDFLAGVITDDLQRITYHDGEYLMRQGETGTSMLYIMEGEVDVIVKLRSLGPRPQTGSKADSVTGDEGTAGQKDANVNPMDASGDTPAEELPSTIVEAALRADEVTSKLRVGKREFVVAVRRGGQFVGEMALFSAPPIRCASVRVRGTVRAVIIPLDVLVRYLEDKPEAKNQLQQMLWSRQSENLVLEALAHLSLICEELEDLMTTSNNLGDYLDD